MPARARSSARRESGNRLRTACALALAVAGLLAAQSLLGIVFARAYRDATWIRATWWGNDWVSLLAAAPLLAAASQAARRGSVRGLLVMIGMLGYAVYNEGFYLFGAALNAFFPLYVLVLGLSAVTLVLTVRQVGVDLVEASFSPRTPRRTLGAYLATIGVGLAAAWLGLWAGYIARGAPLPHRDPQAFATIAALDLELMVPALVTGGVLLWRRHRFGGLVATAAAVQATGYLVVLTVASAVSLAWRTASGTGEVPVWGALTLVTATAAGVLLSDAGRAAALPSREAGDPHAPRGRP